MRAVMLAVMLTGVFAMGGCSFLNAGGAAKTRWANIEKQRAMKANPELAGQQICKSVPITGSNLPSVSARHRRNGTQQNNSLFRTPKISIGKCAMEMPSPAGMGSNASSSRREPDHPPPRAG
jgi:hypothetical protein